MKKETAKEVKLEIKRMLDWMAKQELDDDQISEVVDTLVNHKQTVFLTGLGRSGKKAECFAVRLRNLEYDVRILRETTAPPVRKGDLFIVVSRSGEHETKQAAMAKDNGAKVIAVTANSNSTLAKLADIKFIIPGRSKKIDTSLSYTEIRMKGEPVLPLGTGFEDFAMIVLDSIAIQLAVIQGKAEKDLEEGHKNIQ